MRLTAIGSAISPGASRQPPRGRPSSSSRVYASTPVTASPLEAARDQGTPGSTGDAAATRDQGGSEDDPAPCRAGHTGCRRHDRGNVLCVADEREARRYVRDDQLVRLVGESAAEVVARLRRTCVTQSQRRGRPGGWVRR
jgi:hypothetical protein